MLLFDVVLMVLFGCRHIEAQQVQPPRQTQPPPRYYDDNYDDNQTAPSTPRRIQAQRQPISSNSLRPPSQPPLPPPESLMPRNRVPVPDQRLEFPERSRRQSPARFNIASTDGVGISGLIDAENDFMRLPHIGTSVPAHPPVPPSEPG
ncbi:MAG: hypothetical protein ACKPKO_00835, partial [Candidatus Fonsibacter sp.]